MYLQGIGTYPDEQVAREWLHMAADQGHTESQYVLAKMSYFNDATGADAENAAEWYHMAASKLHPEALSYSHFWCMTRK